ncbi:MAG: hypothetical protein KF752_10775 [Pirellulaceae bacterium]|nr:hypothetical protein [Pirellulaceae bacterium]
MLSALGFHVQPFLAASIPVAFDLDIRDSLAMSTTPESDIKSKVRETIDSLPADATWDDVMYRLYVRQKIEAGLKDVELGRTLSVSEVRTRFGLPE